MGDLLMHAGWAVLKVAAVGLVLGAGVPTIFAFGMRALGIGRTTTPDGQSFAGPATGLGRTLSLLCFGLAALSVLFGIVVIIFGKQIFG